MAQIKNVITNQDGTFTVQYEKVSRTYKILPQTAMFWLAQQDRTPEEEIPVNAPEEAQDAQEPTPVEVIEEVQEEPVNAPEEPQEPEWVPVEDLRRVGSRHTSTGGRTPVEVVLPVPSHTAPALDPGAPTPLPEELGPDPLIRRLAADAQALAGIIMDYGTMLLWSVEDAARALGAVLVLIGAWLRTQEPRIRRAGAMAGTGIRWAVVHGYAVLVLAFLVGIRAAGVLASVIASGWTLRSQIIAEAKAA